MSSPGRPSALALCPLEGPEQIAAPGLQEGIDMRGQVVMRKRGFAAHLAEEAKNRSQERQEGEREAHYTETHWTQAVRNEILPCAPLGTWSI